MLSDRAKKYVVKSLSSAKMLLSLMKDMIDYSQIKVDTLNAHHELINVHQIILECIQTSRDMNSD